MKAVLSISFILVQRYDNQYRGPMNCKRDCQVGQLTREMHCYVSYRSWEGRSLESASGPRNINHANYTFKCSQVIQRITQIVSKFSGDKWCKLSTLQSADILPWCIISVQTRGVIYFQTTDGLSECRQCTQVRQSFQVECIQGDVEQCQQCALKVQLAGIKQNREVVINRQNMGWWSIMRR